MNKHLPLKWNCQTFCCKAPWKNVFRRVYLHFYFKLL